MGHGLHEGAAASREVADPLKVQSLPLLGLYPSAVRWAWTSVGGDLTVVFDSGAVLSVAPDPTLRAWSLGTVYCLPAGPA